MLGSEQRHGLHQTAERWSFSDSFDLRRDAESPPEPEPAPSFILPVNATQNGDYDHIGNYSSTRACSELGLRDLPADRRLHSSCSGLYLDPFSLLQDGNKSLRLNTNPLFLWRNRKRSRVARAVSFDPSQKRPVDKEPQLTARMLAGCHANPMLQKLRLKELERNKFLSKFDIKEHRLVVSSLRTFISRPVQNPSSIPTGPGLSGVLCINLIGGMSLQSPQTLLRDLYCVFEVENTRRARSVIRTNTECFAWEEEFELEVNLVQSVTCLLYQWDRRARHKLCFYGNIDLPSLFLNLDSPGAPASHNKCSVNSGEDSGCFTGSSSATISQDLGSRSVEAACKREEATAISPKMDKIALQMEPNGLLYLELAWFPMRLAYARSKASPSANHNIPLFGCPLRLVLNRERAKIPYIVEKCVSEIDRRGLSICGIYRICGALKLKMQLRNMFELAFYPPESHEVDDHESLIYGHTRPRKPNRVHVNLGPEKVPDIHVITSVLKDFLRELPEPLVTDYLYQMLLDAIKVTSNKQMGPKLIFSILDCMPPENQAVLYYLLDHLKRVSMSSQCNRMTTVQLASVFGPLLFYPSQTLSSRLSPEMLRAHWQISILAQLLDVWPGSKSVYAMLPPRQDLPQPNQSPHVPRSHLHQRRDRFAARGLAYSQETDAGYLSEPIHRHGQGVQMLPQRQARMGPEMPGGRRYHTDLPLRRMYSGDYETYNYQEDAGDTPSRIIPYDPRFYRTRKRL